MQERARKEVLESIGDSEVLSSENIEKIPYTTAFIKESLRYLPTVPLMGRVTKKDCQFGEYDIPKGTSLSFCMYTVNRDPENFDHPDEFIPERFLEDSE